MSVPIGQKYHVCLDLAGLDRTAHLRLFPAIAVPQNKPGVSFIAIAPGALHAPMAMVPSGRRLMVNGEVAFVDGRASRASPSLKMLMTKRPVLPLAW
jgi:hypothetical protein